MRVGNQAAYETKAEYKDAAELFAEQHKFFLLLGRHPNKAVHFRQRADNMEGDDTIA